MWSLSAFRSILQRAIEDIDVLIQPAIPLMGSPVNPDIHTMSEAAFLGERKGSDDQPPPLGSVPRDDSSSNVDLGLEITNAIKKSDKDKYQEIIRKMVKFKDKIELELFMKMRSYRLGRYICIYLHIYT
jgi:hypothetical protein